MKYVSIEKCCSLIEENRIDREHGANVYIMRKDDEIVLEFAYSEAKHDHFILSKITLICSDKIKEEIYQEYLALSMLIETKYNVLRFVDDVRGTEEEK